MTKARAPLSIDAALARIAGQVPDGWDGMAKEVERSPRHVRRWGDAEAREEINIRQMIALDLMFQRHGGAGWPIRTAYGQLLDVAIADRFVDQFEILRRTRLFAKETGEAAAAVIQYTLPGATEKDRADAMRELLEALEAIKNLLPLLEGAPEHHNRGPPGSS